MYVAERTQVHTLVRRKRADLRRSNYGNTHITCMSTVVGEYGEFTMAPRCSPFTNTDPISIGNPGTGIDRNIFLTCRVVAFGVYALHVYTPGNQNTPKHLLFFAHNNFQAIQFFSEIQEFPQNGCNCILLANPASCSEFINAQTMRMHCVAERFC